MNFKGTPGPLYIHDGTQLNEQGKIIGCFDIIDKPGYEKNVKAIAQFFPYGKDRKNNFPDVEEARANAKLYAAAPDMIAELQTSHDFLLQLHSAFNSRSGLDFNSIQQDLRVRMAKQLAVIDKATN